MTSRKRDCAIDFMRFIGMFMVFFSHAGFDDRYPFMTDSGLMILFFASGLTFSLGSFQWSMKSYTAYVRKRFKKLVLPVWIYLVFFFLLFHFLLGFDFNAKYILKSFLLTSGGILFVWVYRVFFISSLTLPVISRIFDRKNRIMTVLICFAVLFLNDFLYYSVKAAVSPLAEDLFKYIVTYTVSVGIVVYSGSLFHAMNKKERIIFITICASVYLACGIYLKFPLKAEYSYPPLVYSISYGLTVASLFYLFLSRFYQKEWEPITWVSANSNRLYLAHIAMYYLLIPVIHSSEMRFLLLALTAFVQVIIYNWLCDKVHKNKERMNQRKNSCQK